MPLAQAPESAAAQRGAQSAKREAQGGEHGAGRRRAGSAKRMAERVKGEIWIVGLRGLPTMDRQNLNPETSSAETWDREIHELRESEGGWGQSDPPSQAPARRESELAPEG